MKKIYITLFFLFNLALQGLSQTVTVSASTVLACHSEPITFDYTSSGLTEPLTCLWDFNTGSFNNFSDECSPERTLPSGTRNVCLTITDDNGVEVEDCIEITVRNIISVIVNWVDPTTCFSSDGSIEVSVSGGVPPHDFLWNDGETSTTRTNMSIGLYTVTVTDGNGCTRRRGQFLSADDLSSPSEIVVTDSNGNIDDDGLMCAHPPATLTVETSGSAIYDYGWSTGEHVPMATAPYPGTYTVTVGDVNGCYSTAEVNIAFGSPTYNIVMLDGTSDTICIGETRTLDAGAGYLSYEWYTGETTQTIIADAGFYNVTVMDSEGCFSVSAYRRIVEKDPLEMEILPVDPICDNGTATLECVINNPDGTTNSYAWAGDGLDTTTGQITTASGLAAGTYSYTVTATDSKGCTATAETTVVVNTAPDISILPVDPICEGEDIFLECVVNNPSNPIVSYEWTGEGLTSSMGQTIMAVGLNPGTSDYIVTATDSNGCTASASVTVVVNGIPVATINSITPATCDLSDGAAELLPSSYNYTWNDGGTGSIRTDLASGIYDVTIIDPAIPDCWNVLQVEIPETTSLVVTIIDIYNPTCGEANGSATISATNGSGNYAYLWNTGATSVAETGLPPGTYQVTVTDLDTGCEVEEAFILLDEEVTPVSIILLTGVVYICEEANDGWLLYDIEPSTGITTTITDADGNIREDGALSVGVYTIRAYDENGCLAAEANSSLTSYGALTVDLQATDPAACGTFDGSVNATAAGGGGELISPYTYMWSNGMETEDMTGLDSGTYTLTVTSYLGCQGIEEATLEVDEIIAPGESTIILCPGDIAILGAAVDGAAYLWSEGSSSQSINTDAVGTYTVTITNASNCMATQNFIVEATDDCVWPGDANYDGLANNQDVLFLGMAYGNTGEARTNPSISWEGQPAPFEWDSTFNNGINQKHADSDGNGIVEQDDTLAIVQNYNLPAHELKETNEGDHILRVDFDLPDSDYNKYVELEVNLADLGEVVPEAYGLAFSLVFNYPEVINPASIQVDFGNSVFGPPSETITLFKYLEEEGRMDFAVTRFDHAGLQDLQGEVVRLGFIIEDNIDGFGPTENYMLQASLTQILCVKPSGEEVTLEATSSELTMLGPDSVSDLEEVEDALDYYPNPIQEVLYVSMKGHSTISQVRAFDTLGRLVDEEKADNITAIKTDDWKAGMYFIEVTDSKDRQYLLKIIKE